LFEYINQYNFAYIAIFGGLFVGSTFLLIARYLHERNPADSIFPNQLGSALIAVSLGVGAFLFQGNIDRARKDQETFDSGVSRIKVSWNISSLAVTDLKENLKSFKDVKTCSDPATRSEFRKFLRSPANALTLTPLADSLREAVFTGPLASKINVARAARIEIYEKRYVNDLARAANNIESKLEALILQIDRRPSLATTETGDDICSALNEIVKDRMRALMSVSIAAALKCDLIAQLSQPPAQLPTKETFNEMEWVKTPSLPEFRGTTIDSGWRVAARNLPVTEVGGVLCNRTILDLVPD
jgi:hypothetical protein